jgi:hypothetical protein
MIPSRTSSSTFLLQPKMTLVIITYGGNCFTGFGGEGATSEGSGGSCHRGRRNNYICRRPAIFASTRDVRSFVSANPSAVCSSGSTRRYTASSICDLPSNFPILGDNVTQRSEGTPNVRTCQRESIAGIQISKQYPVTGRRDNICSEINFCATFAQNFRIKLNYMVIQLTDRRRRSWKKKPGEAMKRVTGATEGAERS